MRISKGRRWRVVRYFCPSREHERDEKQRSVRARARATPVSNPVIQLSSSEFGAAQAARAPVPFSAEEII